MVAQARDCPASDRDDRVMLRGLGWWQYETLLAVRGDVAGPRISYLDGEVELMSPSRTHESIKSLIGRLVEAFAETRGLEITSLGSMTLRGAPRGCGAEPDECYIVGPDKDLPDLVVEVVWTSGGLDKRALYRGLGVRELWLWQDDILSMYVLASDAYQQVECSAVLPNLRAELVSSCLRCSTQTEAVRQFRAALL